MDNGTAIGYALLACKKLGMSKEELERLEAGMHSLMDLVSEDEALEAYKNN